MGFSSAPQPLTKPERIDPLNGVGGIGIRVGSAQHSDRVLADEAARRSVVIPMSVVTQRCFFIELLPLKPCLSKLANAQN